MKLRISVVALGASLVACSSTQPGDESVGTQGDPLSRVDMVGGGGGGVVTGDAGVKDTGPKDSGLPKNIVTGPLVNTLMTPCAPRRWDIALEGRRCESLARTTSNGTWTATSLFPDASDETFKNSHCALRFEPFAPACIYDNPQTVFAVTCREDRSLTRRTDACAQDASQCTGSVGEIDIVEGSAKVLPPICIPGVPDGGSPANNVPGCDSCAQISSSGLLFITNPFDTPNIYAVMPSGQTARLTVTPNGSFSKQVGTSYGTGSILRIYK